MRGGAAAGKKGRREEQAIAKLLRGAGLDAQRIPLSGAAGGRFGGDVVVRVAGVDRRTEVKVRQTDFTRLYGWLEGSDFLVVRSGRRKPLVVLSLALATEIAAAAGGGHDRKG